MNKILVEPERRGDLGAGAPRDDDRLDPRQLAFLILGELAEEELADDRAEDRVAEELEPLVRGQPVVRPRRVRQRLAQEVGATKRVADHLLALLEHSGVVPVSHRRHGRIVVSPKGFAIRSLKLSPRIRVVNSRGRGRGRAISRPRAGITGIGLVRSSRSHGMNESSDPLGILATGARLDTAGHVDHPGTDAPEPLGDVLRGQAAGQDEAGVRRDRSQEVLGDRRARPSGLARDPGVDQHGVRHCVPASRPRPGNRSSLRTSGGISEAEGADDPEMPEAQAGLRAAHRRGAGRSPGRGDRPARRPRRPAGRRTGRRPGRGGQGGDDLGREAGVDVSRRARMEIQADPVRPGLEASQRPRRPGSGRRS